MTFSKLANESVRVPDVVRPDDGQASAGGAGHDFDVAIVGFGPVGQVLAAILGRAGHRVVAFERFQDIYRLPRAVHLDHETMRILQTAGVADEVEEQMVPVTEYKWFGADGEPLLSLLSDPRARSGWKADYLFFQPMLEEALDRQCHELPSVTIERGWSAEALSQTEDGVKLTVRRVEEEPGGVLNDTDEVKSVNVAYVVAADGANSFVRETLGVTRRDLGFQESWLVVDAEPHDMSKLGHLPVACQWCDPKRPTTHVQSGIRNRRWEFMLLPGEQASDFDDPERVWELVSPWYEPEDGPLTRSAVYGFRSMVANQVRSGRVILVGDAAHLTPPFLGQGLCAGFRDAINVAWKLDLVLNGEASAELLDTIYPERQAQNEAVIARAAGLGKILCELDPVAAAARDKAMRENPPEPSMELQPLVGGMLHSGTDGEVDPTAGTLGVQGEIRIADRHGRFDEVVGAGFQLIVRSGDPLAGLSAEHEALLRTLAVKVASLDETAPHGVSDSDGRLTDWFEQNDVQAVVFRPDFYVFGSAKTAAAVPALLDDLQTQLHLNNTKTTAGAIQ